MPFQSIGARKALLSGGAPFTPLSWLGAGLAAWYSPYFAPNGVNVTEVTGAAGTGTVTQVATAITGVGTQFVKECKVGDAISGTLISGNVTAIASATAMTVDQSNSGAGAAFTITPVLGTSARVNRVFDQSGLGRHVDQATRSKMGGLVASAYAGKPGFSLDGADDLWVNATAFLTGSAGAVFATWIMPSGAIPNAEYVLLSSSDQATATFYIELNAYSSTTHPNLDSQQLNNDTRDELYGDTTILAATRYVSIQASTGTAYAFRLNGVAQGLTALTGSNNGDWFADTDNRDNVVLGGLKRTAESSSFRGILLDLCIKDGSYTPVVDDAQYYAWAASIWP